MPDAPTLDAFETEVRTFLDAHAQPKPPAEEFVWGKGDDDVAMFEEVDPETEARQLAAAKGWLRTRAEADLHWIAGPTELGGRGLSREHAMLYARLESGYQVPKQSFFGIGFGMVAPTIQAHGTPATTAYLDRMYRGDLVGCQLFSEPAAGSDLAGLQMRAERDGDEWILNGQKVWTSGAHYSDIGEVICRTDADLPKHKGLTGFVVDMHAPGVEVRPLRQMTGGTAFNEVFFTDVRVPDDHRLGAVNMGWTVALTTLMNERASIGGGSGSGGSGLVSIVRLIEMARAFDRADDPVVRDALMRLYTGYAVSRYTNMRAAATIKAGGLPGPEMSIGKLALTANLTATTQVVSMILGPKLVADTGEWGTFAWSTFATGTPGMRIAGGSDETLRNIVGERVLGLPKEPGIDSKSPFKDLPK
ncbi:acyl-CoA dehydrogenase [Iamia sp. SCSIO 61187]|uniref:acyl-CoA dehydrogenase family protein n=1 Tax=Iamia sp. SCSIO 61187 TaxID=2722752 RepID=UPI001C633F47|nr:acyl-CoA dehydrogenase family protein [Iamia sp. SCSIO 61187]QYG91215.1 acyl-CoA dehydrogenase [Iamia sp. SCSIO 61187]